VDLSRVPEFERAALEVASQIPYGEVRSYKWIAERLGEPDAARAVGGPWQQIPSPHRSLPSRGQDGRRLGGYSFGLIQKEALLNLERGNAPYVGCASTDLLPEGCTHERRIRDGGRITSRPAPTPRRAVTARAKCADRLIHFCSDTM